MVLTTDNLASMHNDHGSGTSGSNTVIRSRRSLHSTMVECTTDMTSATSVASSQQQQSVMLHRMVFPMHALQFTAPIYHIPNHHHHHHAGHHVDPRMNNLPCVTEIRREKSRDAARSRRGKENYEFLSLSRLLPLPSAITGQLDKASIIRLCISSLKLRKFSRQGDPVWPAATLKVNINREFVARVPATMPNYSQDFVDSNFGSNLLQAHDGFVMAISAEGHILYISETVSVYLGLSQVELTGSSLFEYIHEDDRMELADALNIPWDPSIIFQDLDITAPPAVRCPSHDSSSDSTDGVIIGTQLDRKPLQLGKTSTGWKSGWKSQKRKTSYCVRFRSTLTKRGVQMKYSGYRVLSIQWQGRYGENKLDDTSGGETATVNYGFSMCATALPSLNMSELRVDKSSFTMKLTLDFKILSCDARMEEMLHYPPDLLQTGSSFYEMTYGVDHDLVCELHHDVLRKGQTMSSYYRIMGGKGGYFWLQTCAHLMAASKTPNDQCIVAVHHLISNIQFEKDVYGIIASSTKSSITGEVSSVVGKGEKKKRSSSETNRVTTIPPKSLPEKKQKLLPEKESAAAKKDADTKYYTDANQRNHQQDNKITCSSSGNVGCIRETRRNQQSKK